MGKPWYAVARDPFFQLGTRPAPLRLVLAWKEASGMCRLTTMQATCAHVEQLYLGDCQNCGPFLGPYYNTGPNTGPNLGDPKRDHNFDNSPFIAVESLCMSRLLRFVQVLRA